MAFRPKLIKHSEIVTVNLSESVFTAQGVISQSVVTGNTLIRRLQYTSNNNIVQAGYNCVRIALDDSTHVSAHLNGDPTGGASIDAIVAYILVVEYYSGILRNLQRGTMNLLSGTSSISTTLTRDTSWGYDLELLGCEETGVNIDGQSVGRLNLSGTTLNYSTGGNSSFDALVGYQYCEM